MRSAKLLERVNALNSNDIMVQDVLSAIGQTMDEADAKNAQIVADQFFDTCSEEMLEVYEREARITPLASQTIADRRSAVAAKWKSEGKVDIALLQAVANSWKYGKVDVDFVDNKIQITFVDTVGVPTDTAGLELALDDVKPAHLPIYYLIVYLYVRDVSVMTVAELQTQKIGNFAFGGND